MKTLCFFILLITVLSVTIAQSPKIKTDDDTAELKLSLNTKVINKLVSFIGNMIDNMTKGAPIKIPLDIDVQGKWNLYSVKVNHLALVNHTINWNSSAITINPLDTNTFQLSINNVGLNFTAFEDIEVTKLIEIKNVNTSITFVYITINTPTHIQFSNQFERY